ncbi:ThiF family adenylyltransferase (plasmid) [Variovorax sp. 375MFSha3.1]|uniref:ThiF family adenylyltransferase n=1 Tax=unclassified Variovorax TaxID=663243 RepID=UPI003AAA9635
MSQLLISRSADLKRLRDAGYEVEVRSNYLLVHAVPYLDAAGNLLYGTLASELTLASPLQTAAPSTHVAYFFGSYPHNADGTRITALEHGTGPFQWAEGLAPNFSFSNKPRSGAFIDYFEKMVSYVNVIWHQARARYPDCDPMTFRVVEPQESDSVFEYEDTASSRAGIQMIAQQMKNQKICIVGVGGTGAYILDLAAKTHVAEIHMFDGDRFRQHNAFRAPGAASRDDLEKGLPKVEYLRERYAQMRRGIISHDTYISEANVAELSQFDFVFVCVDRGSARRTILDFLSGTNVPFIDVGMEVQVVEETNRLWGTCRVTTSTPSMREHLATRVSTGDREADELYRSNIQVAELNAMNAVLAVIRWKRLCNYYHDDSGDHDCTFTSSLNKIVNNEVRL